jgi:hypothetical protein
MPKEKISFTIDGIKYTDISVYTYKGNDRTKYNASVSGTAQMVRQWMKQKYPNIPTRNYYWVQSESYSGGDSIRIYLNNAPKDLYEKLNKELNDKFEEGKFDGMTDSYSYTKSAETSEEGLVIDYGTKYLFVNNYKPSDSDAPSVDWDAVLSQKSTPTKPSTPSPTPSGEKKSYTMGEVLKDCAGWIITKKVLPDGRIVYNAKIKPDTSKNKVDWNIIKGEIYVDTGFKWGRFGAFEKWGQIASEAFVVNKLCEILGKYYDGSDLPAPEPQPEPETNKNILGLYVNGEFIQNVSSQAEAYEILSNNFGSAALQTKIDNNQVYFNMSRNRIDLIRDSYVYGKKWGVPEKYGNELQFAFIDKGYMVYVASKKNSLVVYKISMANDGVIINDNGGEFNLDRYGYNENIGSVNYEIDGNPVSTVTLAYSIDDIVTAFFKNQKEEDAPKPETKYKEDIEKAIKGLQYLADKGNEKAINAIKGLKYLLNK